MPMIKRGPLILAGLAAGLGVFGAAPGANLTPPNLGAATSLADQDLFVVWPNASGGPLESIQWSALRAQIAAGLGSTWLLPANNLSELTNISVARANLGLGTAAVANTGSSGATVPLLSSAGTWSGVQTFTAALATGVAEPAGVQNIAADAAGDEAGLDLQPSATGCRALISGYRDGSAANTGIKLWPCSGSSRFNRLQLSNAGALVLSAYGAGLAQLDASGALTSSYTVPSALTVSVASNSNGVIINNASLSKNAILYPLTDGSDTDLIFLFGSGNTYTGQALKLSGVDGSVTAANALAVNGNTTLGSGTSNTVTVAGANLARPTMPAFSAKLSAALLNVTGAALTYTVPFNTAIFDRHGDFNTSTGAFTVPFTGIYQCSARLTLTGVASDNSRFQLQMHGTINDYVIDLGKLAADANGRVGATLSDLISLSAGSTLVLRVEVEGHGSNNVGILNDGGGGSSAPTSTFSCAMVG